MAKLIDFHHILMKMMEKIMELPQIVIFLLIQINNWQVQYTDRCLTKNFVRID